MKEFLHGHKIKLLTTYSKVSYSCPVGSTGTVGPKEVFRDSFNNNYWVDVIWDDPTRASHGGYPVEDFKHIVLDPFDINGEE